MAVASKPASRPRRQIFYVNGATALSLFLVLAALALVATPPAPATVAEFAPQAQQQIQDAPEEQSAGAAVQATATAETIVVESEAAREAADDRGVIEVIEGVPSALNCVQWPDGSVTQTFDRQSPPCIASWDVAAGNGGSTSKGVTANEVAVAVALNAEADSEWAKNYQVVLDHFNTAYQLYGRQFRLELYQPESGTGTATAEQQRAEAIHVAQELGAFASVDQNQPGPTMVSELARMGVIAASARTGIFTTEELRAMSPYVWTYGNTLDAVERDLGEFICKSLGGDRAEHAGDIALQQRERQFAILYHEPRVGDDPVRVGPLVDRLAQCGLDVPVHQYPADQATRLVVMQDVQSSGATSLIVSGQSVSYNMMPDATRLGFYPEWIGLGDEGQFSPGAWSNEPAQAANAFGMAPGNKPVSVGEDPYSQVLRNGGGDPGFGIGGFYASMLVVASGVQLAGADLTPESFARGLQETTFPNPGAGTSPAFQATVGFHGDQAMLDDVALWWWDSSRPPAQGVQPGGFCLVGNGTRWLSGQWPEGRQPLFDRSGGC
ncbi:MAG: hypothetical protein ACI867_000699 [Glaciecola sp.]|jgi:hypothetical protein